MSYCCDVCYEKPCQCAANDRQRDINSAKLELWDEMLAIVRDVIAYDARDDGAVDAAYRRWKSLVVASMEVESKCNAISPPK